MTPLRRRMIDDMTLRNFTPRTIDTYVSSVARFAAFFHTSPEHLGPEHLRTYLLHLLQKRRVSLSYYNRVRSRQCHDFEPSFDVFRTQYALSRPTRSSDHLNVEVPFL